MFFNIQVSIQYSAFRVLKCWFENIHFIKLCHRYLQEQAKALLLFLLDSDCHDF